jgi:CubicO group peptidase (beta-lactamase class C family)
MHMRRLLTCVVSLVPALLAAQQAPLQGFDAYAAKAMKDWQVPGMAIVVVKDDSVVFMKGYGVRELGKPDPVTVHTRFGNMSTTKAFTAMLIAMLADSGKVAFDDPVSKFEPTVQFADPYVTREITVRDLLTHRVGFPDPYYLWDDGTLTFDQMAARLRLVPVATSFRSHFAYNNVAYALAGDVAARAAGSTWQQLMRTRIYAPLGMTESYPDAATMAAAGVRDVTSPHGLVRDTARLLPVAATVVDPVAPAGAAFTTVTDMAKWIRFLLDSGKVGGRRLVSAENFAELFRPQQIVGDDEFYPTARLTHPHFQGYGMGWFLEDYRGEYVAFHTGSIEGRTAIVGLIPDRHLGVAIFTNLDHSEVRHALMYTVFDRYIGPGTPAHDWSAEMHAMYKAFADSGVAQQRRAEARRIPGTHPSLPLDKYAGTYTDSLFGTTEIRFANGQLTARAGTLTGVMEPWQYDVFRVTWSDPFVDPTFVSFSLDPDGTVGEARLVGGPQHYRRVK